MTAQRWVLALLVIGCSPPVPAWPDVAELTPAVELDDSHAIPGYCGSLVVGPHEVVTPAHCAPRGETVIAGRQARIRKCGTLQDLCTLETEGEPFERVAVVRAPRPLEPVIVTTPSGERGRAIVLAVSHQWRAAWIDWAALRGDSGAIGWGADGAALVMLTGYQTGGGPAWGEVIAWRD